MLLDFNLSTDIKLRAGIGELRVGGTLPYMAPEHLAALKGGDRKLVDARSDLYSLGVILYELLTGRLPFEVPHERLADLLPTLIAERRKAPPLLRPFNRAIPFAVESLVRHCLEPEPKQALSDGERIATKISSCTAKTFPCAMRPTRPSANERRNGCAGIPV